MIFKICKINMSVQYTYITNMIYDKVKLCVYDVFEFDDSDSPVTKGH